MRKTAFSTILLIALFCANFNGAYAQQQQKTAYEQKVLEIKRKYVKKIFVSVGKWTQEMESGMRIANEDEVEVAFQTALMVAQVYCPVEIRNAETELYQAEKLKTTADFQREKARKEQEERAKKQKEEREAYERSDAGGIQKSIKAAFEEWNQKSEFEKETDYAERLKTQSKEAFDNVCAEATKKRISIIYEYNSLKKELLNYNSESETFSVVFKGNGTEGQSKINIPIAQAENFKSGWSRFNFEENIYDWCFVENNLFPTLVTLLCPPSNSKRPWDGTKLEFPLNLKNQQEITCPFDNLEIENPYLKGYVFKYSNAKQQAIEQQRRDSLEFEKYSQRLDSIFNDRNRKLLQNPYNATKKTLEKYRKMEKEGDREDNFNRCLRAMEADFDKVFYELSQGEKTLNEFQEKASARKSLNLKDVNSLYNTRLKSDSKEALAVRYYVDIKMCKDKPYYPKIVDFVVETNNGLNKEWSKNKDSFKDNIEFYEAYVSGNYNEILKGKKKK